MFTLVNATLLSSPPYPDAERLYMINANVITTFEGKTTTAVGRWTSIDMLPDFRERTPHFERVAAWGYGGTIWHRGDSAQRLSGGFVTTEFFDTIGMPPLYGRTFTAEDVTEKVAVLAYGFWQRNFAGDPSMVGHTLRLEIRGKTSLVTIVGIMPPGFDFPSERFRATPWTTEFWMPWPFPTNLPITAGLLARAKPDASPQLIAEDLARFSEALRMESPDSIRRIDYFATPIAEQLNQQSRQPVLIFAGAVALMLFIVCFNVANLMLVRATNRHSEIAVRQALGAPRSRITRLLLTESLLVSAAGGVLGLGLAYWTLAVFNASPQLIALGLPPVSIDITTAIFAAVFVALTGLLFGLAPSISATGVRIQSVLQQQTRSMSSGTAMRRFRQALLVGQVAFSLTLLVGAGLLAKSYYQILATDSGFDTRQLISVGWNATPVMEPDEMLQRLRSLPGVDAVALSQGAPGTSTIGGFDFTIDGGDGEHLHSQTLSVTPEYFDVLGVPLTVGRLFRPTDHKISPMPVVANRTFVREIFGGENPIGRQFTTVPYHEESTRFVIVGIVEDFRQRQLEQAAPRMVYTPMRELDAPSPVIRTSPDPGPLLQVITDVLAAGNPDQPPPDVKTVERRFSDALSPRRFNAALAGAFALIAMTLAAIGIYGVISYLMTQRSTEMGIRTALGARPRQLMSLVMGEGLRLGILGVALGLAGAYSFSRFLEHFLLNVSTTDTAVYTVLTLLLLVVVALACLAPARRAAASDPAEILRDE